MTDTRARRNVVLRCLAACVLALLADGCSGGGGAGLPPASPSRNAAAKMEQVTFTMHCSSAAPASKQRAPQYVPATALSVSVAVNGGTAQYLNAPATTLAINAPVGTDTFVFQTYDQTNGHGNVLSSADVTQSIVDGAANVVSAVLNGIVSSLAVAVGNSTFPAGTPTTTPITVTVKDPDGNAIIGAGNYSELVTLTIDDPAKSGALSLSASSLASPASTSTLNYSGGTLSSASIVAAATGVASASAAITPTPAFTSFTIPDASAAPNWIAAGPDGNMWFTEQSTGKVTRVTPAGVFSVFSIPTAASGPAGIIAGSDGRMWFAEFNTSKIAAITTNAGNSEGVTEFTTPTSNAGPGLLVDRRDGTIWYTEFSAGGVGYVSYTGASSGDMSVGGGTAPYGIATASDNNLYFAEGSGSAIGFIGNLGGAVTTIPLASLSSPLQIIQGPDGNLWFADYGTSKIGKLVPGASSATEFPTLTPNAQPYGITVGADGALWFTEFEQGKIGRITTAGVVTEYTIPGTSPEPRGIAAAANGTLWFTEEGLNKIGVLTY